MNIKYLTKQLWLLLFAVLLTVSPTKGRMTETHAKALLTASKNASVVTLKKITLKKGKSFTLKITGVSTKSWSSSDKSVATVTAKGKITARKTGKTTITCTGNDGRTYKCKVTVKGSSKSLSAKKIYKAMIALKKKYPEGKPWSNSNYYDWKGGIYIGGYGCSAFAFRLSDAAFGDLPARTHTKFSKIKVGDIVRMNHNTHSVIVLQVKNNSVIVAEGNYNNSVHWGREISMNEIRKTGTYVMTRYPK